MTSQTVDFKVRADTKQAQAEVDKLNGKFTEGASAAGMLDKRIESLTKDLDDLSTAVVSGKGNTEAYRTEMQRLERQLDAIHGVAPRVSSNLNTMTTSMEQASGKTRNVGQAALEASRAMEDLQYGLGGVVNNIPSLVMSLGGTAGLTAVISLGAVAVNQLAKNFTSVDPAAKEASDKAREHVKALRGEIEGLAQDLRALQVGADRAKMERQGEFVQTAADAASSAVAATGLSVDAIQRLKDRTDLPAVMQENIAKATKALAALDDEIAKLAGMRRIELEKEDQKRIDAAVDAANAVTEAEKRARQESSKDADEMAKARYDQFIAHMDDEDKALAEVAKARRENRKKEQAEAERDADKAAKDLVRFYQKQARDEERDKQKQERDAERAHKLHLDRLDRLSSGSWADRLAFSAAFVDEELTNLDRLSKAELRQLEERREAWASFYEGVQQHAVGAVGVVTSAGTAMIDDIITGQELAFETFATSIMKQAGQSLISDGVKLSGAAVVSLLTGNFPTAAAQGAGAAALIGSGMALGGVATGIMHTAKGGTIGSALPDKSSARDPGASPSGSSGGSGGPLVVNISYGVGGPLPEDTAREVRKVLDVDSRR